jgi:hypothetical protein
LRPVSYYAIVRVKRIFGNQTQGNFSDGPGFVEDGTAAERNFTFYYLHLTAFFLVDYFLFNTGRLTMALILV